MSIYIVYKIAYLLYNYYGDNMNKKGFTLIELLAVIALLGVIIVFAVPNVIKVFTANKDTLSSIQKQQLRSAVQMYLNDYCTEPISDDYTCPSGFTTSIDDNTGTIKVTSGEMELRTFARTDYFNEKDITHNCSGTIIISNGEIDLSQITCNFDNSTNGL